MSHSQEQLVSPPRYPVLNVSVHLLNDYQGWLVNRLNRQLGTHVVTLNAEMAMLAEKEPELAEIIQNAEFVIPDGSGIVFYLRLRGHKIQRCPGIELAESFLASLENQAQTYSVAFYGGKPGIAVTAAKVWQQKIPKLQIIAQHGYLPPEEQAQWQQTLQAQQPQIILVGLGVPRQEFWIQKNRHLCPNSIWIGVGGSFDIWSGYKSRAPAWLSDNHLEWSYRLYQEPWRWKRMLALPQFFWRSLR
ncbi:glycosyl transferase, WecB/TagA/CpsF family [Stanieria cyanosphaera PCC 7437]|uniref:Glycosyl transferase, WecB/TagA/CpsF family n=1 Tax=Stanieria cyanosphaera (strain ATCC 29371 / PCC 7437) TaxID=111780 RepID=K9Y170_STAC7|nr:WecB/TagA/CpsF family glycosyltransferase [Stanieria cyanosphaera]AFZ37712.1 glycosyl transferase, WecB/TagA/CpsF family [Stanieria cyanosphaera PCC 7437]